MASYKKLQGEAEQIDKRLALNRSAGARTSLKDIDDVEKAVAKFVKEWRARKKMFRDIWDTVSENYDGNQKELFSDIGVDLDEDVNEDVKDYEKHMASNKRVKCMK